MSGAPTQGSSMSAAFPQHGLHLGSERELPKGDFLESKHSKRLR